MEGVSECAVAVARRIVAAGALTLGVVAVPTQRTPRLALGDASIHAFLADLAAALHALTAVTSSIWSAPSAPSAPSPLVALQREAAAARHYLLCNLAGFCARGEQGAAASVLNTIIVLAPTGCDDRDVSDLLHALPRDRMLGVVLIQG